MSEKNNLHESFLKLRLWLKIGLSQEKKGDYDSAKTSYLEAMKLSEKYFQIIKSPSKRKNDTHSGNDIPGLNFSSLKLFYQPYFCLAFLQEKNPALAHANLQITEDFITVLQNLIAYSPIKNLPNLPLFLAECQSKYADLLFFKGFVPQNLGAGARTPDEFYYINQSEEWYWNSIKILINHYLDVSFENNDLQNLLKNLLKILFTPPCEPSSPLAQKTTMSATAQIYHLLAMNLSKLGNILLSKINNEDGEINFKQLIEYFESKTPFKHDNLISKRFIQILSCYYYAARLFLRAGMHKECAFEYEKLIRALRYFDIQKVENDDDIADMKQTINYLEEKVFHVGEKHYDIAYAHINRKILHQPLKNSLLIKPAEIESLRLQWLGLLHNFIKTIKNKKLNFVKQIQQKLDDQFNQISTDAYFDNIMYRIDCLNFKTIHLAEKFQNEIGFFPIKNEDSLLTRNQEEKLLKEALNDKKKRARLLNNAKDGLFCCINSIEMREIHSNTYWWLHLGRAFLHRFLADWAHRYDFICQSLHDVEKNNFESDVCQYLGSKRLKYVDEKYQLRNALENFHCVKQAHTGGKTYKSLIQRMFYLNDDFNDRIYHFYLAQERFEIHRGKVKKKIDEVEEILKNNFPEDEKLDI